MFFPMLNMIWSPAALFELFRIRPIESINWLNSKSALLQRGKVTSIGRCRSHKEVMVRKFLLFTCCFLAMNQFKILLSMHPMIVCRPDVSCISIRNCYQSLRTKDKLMIDSTEICCELTMWLFWVIWWIFLIGWNEITSFENVSSSYFISEFISVNLQIYGTYISEALVIWQGFYNNISYIEFIQSFHYTFLIKSKWIVANQMSAVNTVSWIFATISVHTFD